MRRVSQDLESSGVLLRWPLLLRAVITEDTGENLQKLEIVEILSRPRFGLLFCMSLI